MEKTDKAFLKQVKRDVLKDAVLQFLFKYKFYILSFLLTIVVVVIAYFSYDYYMKSKANKNSIVFSKAKDELVAAKDQEAIALLDELIKNGTEGYQLISYLEKSALFLRQGKTEESINVLDEAIKNVSLPSYYKDMLQSIKYIIKANNLKDAELEGFITEIGNNLDKDGAFYFTNLEIYASLLVKQGNYEQAFKVYEEIVSTDAVPADLKDRAKRIKGILSANPK